MKTLRNFALGAALLAVPTLVLPQTARAADSTATETVLVRRLVKGAQTAELVRVPVGRHSANGSRVEASSRNCPGTTCPRTKTCRDTKGALGTNCKAV